MGRVFRALDSRLERQVAIKVLPAGVAGDAERRARFEREARALASLNHSNIARIYGVEEAGDAFAIVMELVEGEDLAARIARKPLRWADAQPIARQIAEALDAAHERGIVHRDLKPANIRAAIDGTIKVLDFGLAKMMSAPEAETPNPALSPTVTASATRLGAILGTAAYMSPEQATGRAVDKRADIWAFGVILFEMLTGRSPFAAESAVESLGLVVTKEPDWSALPADVPTRVGELLRRILAKDPRARLRDIGDALHVLNAAGLEEARQPRTAAGPFAGRTVLFGASAALTLAALAAVLAWTSKPVASIPLRLLELPPALASAVSVAISPDGTRLAYLSEGRLFVRSLDDAAVREIGTTPPTSRLLAWSPDSRSIAFFAAGSIHAVSAGGGPVLTICRVPGPGSAIDVVWHPDGRIIFSASRDSLYAVAGAGGTPELLLPIDQSTEIDFHDIGVAPDGRLLVHVHRRGADTARLEIVDVEKGHRTVLSPDPSAIDFSHASGMLLFRRTTSNQGVWALPFSDRPLDLSRAVLIAPGATAYSVSGEGTMIVQSEALPMSTLEWLGSDGTFTKAAGPPIPNLFPWIALSSDGTRAAYVARGSQPALYVRDLATGADTQLTDIAKPLFDAPGAPSGLTHPTWFPTGDRLLFVRRAAEDAELMVQQATGVAAASFVANGGFGRVTPDGNHLLWIEDDRGQGRLRQASIGKDGTIGEARNGFPGSERLNVRWVDVSPDGRLLAYVASEASLRSNVHLVSFPDGNARWQVTTEGGTFARFSHDGRALFYFTGGRSPSGGFEQRMMTMPLDPGPPLRLGVPTVRFTGREIAGFDVAHDGRLLVARSVPLAPGEESRAMLVQNWPLLARGRTR